YLYLREPGPSPARLLRGRAGASGRLLRGLLGGALGASDTLSHGSFLFVNALTPTLSRRARGKPVRAVRSCVAAQFADLDRIAVARTLPCDGHRGVVVVG